MDSNIKQAYYTYHASLKNISLMGPAIFKTNKQKQIILIFYVLQIINVKKINDSQRNEIFQAMI